MKVAMVLAKRSVGGTAELACQWAEDLMDSGVSVCAMTLSDGAGEPPRSLRRLEELVGELPSMGHRGKADSLRTLRRLRHALRSTAPDVVHSYFPIAEGYCSLATAGTRRPVVGTLVGQAQSPARWQAPRTRIGTLLCPSRWISLSQAVTDSTTDNGYPGDRISVVYPGFRLPEVDGDAKGRTWISQARGERPGNSFIVVAGRLAPSKRVHLAVRALAELPENFELVVAGAGEEHSRLAELAQRCEVQDRVHFLGLVQDVPALIASADVYVTGTSSEGLVGYTTLEAAGVKTPIVAPAIPSITELLDDRSVWLVEHPEPQEFAKAIRLILGSSHRSSERAQTAFEVVSTAFAPAAIASSLIGVYERAIAESGDGYS